MVFFQETLRKHVSLNPTERTTVYICSGSSTFATKSRRTSAKSVRSTPSSFQARVTWGLRSAMIDQSAWFNKPSL